MKFGAYHSLPDLTSQTQFPKNYRNRLKTVKPRTKILNPGTHEVKKNKQQQKN